MINSTRFECTIEAKIRKNNIEGLSESYYGESVRVYIDIYDVMQQVLGYLVDLADDKMDCAGEEFGFSEIFDFVDYHGDICAETLAHFMILGGFKDRELEKQKEEWIEKQKKKHDERSKRNMVKSHFKYYGLKEIKNDADK